MPFKTLYKVQKVMRNTGRKKLIEKNLTIGEARRLVKSFPSSDKYMVIFTQQSV